MGFVFLLRLRQVSLYCVVLDTYTNTTSWSSPVPSPGMVIGLKRSWVSDQLPPHVSLACHCRNLCEECWSSLWDFVRPFHLSRLLLPMKISSRRKYCWYLSRVCTISTCSSCHWSWGLPTGVCFLAYGAQRYLWCDLGRAPQGWFL